MPKLPPKVTAKLTGKVTPPTPPPPPASNSTATPLKVEELPEKKIKVLAASPKFPNSPYFKTVSAKYLGELGIHKSIQPNNLYTVTAITCGLSIASFIKEEDAIQFAKYLWRKECLALRLEKKEEILKAMSAWSIQWSKDCDTKQEYIDPTPYQKSKK